MSAPLDYRNPSTGTSRRQKIILALQQTEALDFASMATRLAIGVPLTLAAPFFLTIFVKFICFNFRWPWPLGFFSTFFLLCFVIVPWQMWYERRTHGGFYMDAARSHGDPLDADSMGEYRMNQTRAAAAVYVELALTGPRMLWEAIDRFQGRGKLDMSRLTAAAEIADELLAAGQGIEVRQLITPDRPLPRVRELVEFLKQHDWADTSTDGKRVWIRSDVTKRFGSF
ncbi:MAG TPA: hypothetical protein PLD59_09775 [Tepidisphaeraceae bacterium]|nr:hypothetical protein [Tepidisphaeraceae bacterium]